MATQVSMQQELKTQEFPTNIPFVFEVGTSKWLDLYHESYFYINITRIEKNIIQAKNFKITTEAQPLKHYRKLKTY